MLEEKLEVHTAIHKCNMFMQDDAPCHRSKLVSAFFKRKNIKTFHCTGNSPSLNPIENLWVMWQINASAKNLEMAIERIWTQKITAKYCKYLLHRCLVVCKLLSRTKVDTPNTGFLHKNWIM